LDVVILTGEHYHLVFNLIYKTNEYEEKYIFYNDCFTV